jgi:hypothetical protein
MCQADEITRLPQSVYKYVVTELTNQLGNLLIKHSY